MDTHTYHAGEKMEAAFDFLYGERILGVTATFAHEDDPETRIHLSGVPEEHPPSDGAGYTSWRVVLSGRTVTVGDRLGTYRCEAVEAEYPGGRKVHFGGIPDVGIEIAEEELPPPEISGDWEWNAGY